MSSCDELVALDAETVRSVHAGEASSFAQTLSFAATGVPDHEEPRTDDRAEPPATGETPVYAVDVPQASAVPPAQRRARRVPLSAPTAPRAVHVTVHDRVSANDTSIETQNVVGEESTSGVSRTARAPARRRASQTRTTHGRAPGAPPPIREWIATDGHGVDNGHVAHETHSSASGAGGSVAYAHNDDTLDETMAAYHGECDHDRTRYTNPLDVPVAYCARCASVVVPEHDGALRARAIEVPISARRDARLAELVAIHNEHARAERYAAHALAQRYAALRARLEHWREQYASGAPVDYAGLHHPVYRALARDLRVSATTAEMAASRAQIDARHHRSAFVDALRQAVPSHEHEFVRNARRMIRRARPTPFYYPDLDAAECTVCGDAVRVRLHRQTPRCETRVVHHRAHPARVVTDELPTCRCRRFPMCLKCLLSWYWLQTDQLQRSFATCPTCRAEFTLDDVVPVAPINASAPRPEDAVERGHAHTAPTAAE